MRFHANNVSASEAGDYFQVAFAFEKDEDDVDGPYLRVQRQFEDWHGGVCYVETHDENYTGHFLVTRLDLTPSRLLLEIDRPQLNVIEVTFEIAPADFPAIARIASIIDGTIDDY